MLISTLIAIYLSTYQIEPKTSVMSVYERTEQVIEPIEETFEQVIERVGKEEGLQDWEIERFKKIAWCESRYNPRAVSRTGDFGILQLNDYYWDFDHDKVFDPEYNVRYAIQKIYARQGFNAWVCNRLID